MENVMKGDTKAKFTQHAKIGGSCNVTYFSKVMETMAVHIFPTYVYFDQKQYLQRYFRKTLEIKK